MHPRAGNEFDSDSELTTAVEQSMRTVDGEDAGSTISPSELASAQRWLTARRPD